MNCGVKRRTKKNILTQTKMERSKICKNTYVKINIKFKKVYEKKCV